MNQVNQTGIKLENLFLEPDTELVDLANIRKPKSVKISAQQLALHRAKHGASPELKLEIVKAQEIQKYGREARLKRLRKEDTRSILVEKGTRPKGAFYDTSSISGKPKHSLDSLFKVDGETEEGLNEARILHFGGKLD